LARKVEARLQDIEAIYNFDLGDEFEVAICALPEHILPAKYGVCREFGAPLCLGSAPGNAYGLGLVILLQALSWV
jgi:hypothetical protein